MTLAELLSTHARAGAVCWIGARPARRAPVEALEAVEIAASGLVPDRRGSPGKRAVTLLQWEHLAVIGALLGQGPVDPAQLRRNVAVRGINLLALRKARFRIGGAVLRGTGVCAPCSRMTEAFGPGGYNAVRGHGGICAEVEVPGTVRIGDTVVPL